MENNFKCKNCGCEIFEIVTSGPHKKLICSYCNSYIAFVSSNNVSLKYKDEKKEDCKERKEDELPWD